MKMTRVAVLRGGPSDEYEVSMNTGKEVLRALARLKYPTKDITITRSGDWLHDGRSWTPQQIFEGIDVVFLALHGNYGEDGQIQRLLEQLHLPFTGSRGYPSSVALNKYFTKQFLKNHRVRSPRDFRVRADEVGDSITTARQIVGMLGEQLVIKPVASGSSLDTHLVSTELEVPKLLEELAGKGHDILVEERITGREATVGVIEGVRGESLYILPAVEIVPPRERSFFDYTCKYDGSTNEICPGRFSDDEKQAMQTIAKTVHEALGLSHYSRSDFIVKDGVPYFLEVNTLPGLTAESLFPKATAAVGMTYDELIDHLVQTATPH